MYRSLAPEKDTIDLQRTNLNQWTVSDFIQIFFFNNCHIHWLQYLYIRIQVLTLIRLTHYYLLERARWIKSCAVIGRQSGQYLARSGVSAVSCKKHFPKSHHRSRWLHIGLIKVSARVISYSLLLRLTTLPRPWWFWIPQKPHPIID